MGQNTPLNILDKSSRWSQLGDFIDTWNNCTESFTFDIIKVLYRLLLADELIMKDYVFN